MPGTPVRNKKPGSKEPGFSFYSGRTGLMIWLSHRGLHRMLFQVALETSKYRKTIPAGSEALKPGEDFVTWLHQELRARLPQDFLVFDPIDEDYGWGFWVWVENGRRWKDTFWVCLSLIHDELPTLEDGEPESWMVVMNYDPALNILKRIFHRPDPRNIERLNQALMDALQCDPALRNVRQAD
jgi:hypothetical protein